MAALLSIPEANTTSHQFNFNKAPPTQMRNASLEQHRQKHRIFPVSKRHTRARHSLRLINTRPPPCQEYQQEGAADGSGTFVTDEVTESAAANGSSSALRSPFSADGVGSEPGPSIASLFRYSQGSVNLDAFPLPPSRNQYSNQHTRHKAAPSEAVNKSRDRKQDYTADRYHIDSVQTHDTNHDFRRRSGRKENTVLRPSPNTLQDGHHGHHGLDGIYSSTSLPSVDMALVDAISRNILNQIQRRSDERRRSRRPGQPQSRPTIPPTSRYHN